MDPHQASKTHRFSSLRGWCEVCGASQEMVEDLRMPCPGKKMEGPAWEAYKWRYGSSHVLPFYVEHSPWRHLPVKEDVTDE